MNRVVEIADLAVSNAAGGCLVTHSLGSCIGVAIWDPVARVGGLLHFMLPDSNSSPEKATVLPAMFCDTGVTRMFFSAYELGAAKRRLVVKIAGGAALLGNAGQLSVGKRNYLALRKLFWKNGVVIEKEDVGGSASRTMTLDLETGAVIVQTRAGEVQL
jgi:chemotaxis protein CheD